MIGIAFGCRGEPLPPGAGGRAQRPRRARATRFGLVLSLLSIPALAQDRLTPARPGISFQSAETQAIQADDARNPGMLWVEQGAKLWNEAAGTSGKSCASCHGAAETSMKGVAARYPRVATVPNGPDPARFEVINLERQINLCATTRQGRRPALAYDSPVLLSLSAFTAYQSRGMRRPEAAGAGHDPVLQQGHRVFHTRQGQLNLSCAQCHDDLVGKKLRGDTISQAQTHGWPAYRLEWQTMGSLQRRLRACSLGVRAEVLPYDHPDYLALEYYLAWRGAGLPLESPGVRR